MPYLLNWYTRERYAGIEPFRWMRGTRSLYLWRVTDATPRSKDGKAVLELRYKCPNGNLDVNAVGADVAVVSLPDDQGWQRLQVLVNAGVPVVALKLGAASELHVPTDPRALGCQVSERSAG